MGILMNHVEIVHVEIVHVEIVHVEIVREKYGVCPVIVSLILVHV